MKPAIIAATLAGSLTLIQPHAFAAQQWTFCVASAQGARDVWISDVFAVTASRQGLEAELKRALERQGHEAGRRAMPSALRQQSRGGQRADDGGRIQSQARRRAARSAGAAAPASRARRGGALITPAMKPTPDHSRVGRNAKG